MTDTPEPAVPPAPATAREARRLTRRARSTTFGLIALAYSIAVLVLELVLIGAAQQVMSNNLFQDLLGPFFVALLVGILLCMAVGDFAPRGRRYAVIGGFVMAAPFLVLMLMTLPVAFG